MGNLFGSIADKYRQGQMNNELDLVFGIAAADGVVLLPGADRPFASAKGGPFEVSDLLLPCDLTTWQTLSRAYNAGIQIFPEWFQYDPEKKFFDFNQENFCLSFIRCKSLTKHHGTFLMNGEPATVRDVKQAIRRSLAIVRKDAGSLVYGTYSALSDMVEDDSPVEASKNRMTRAVLADELASRGYAVRYNAISREYETTGRTDAGRVASLDDISVIIHDALSDAYKGVSFETLSQYLAFEAREHTYNPVLELLSATEWDGVDRMPELYHLMGIEEDTLSQALVMKWLLQSVALLFNDASAPFGADGCLVLNGDQGTGKTSLFRHLALKDEWFGEGMSVDDKDKDTRRRIVSVWLAELGEVESTLKSDISALKAFVSAAVDHYRLPYGKADVVSPRLTSLCATCNSDRYLVDTTGNRRWWSVPFNRTVPRNELLALDALQLWAQVYSIVAPLTYEDKASCFRLTESQRMLLAERNGEYEKPSKGQPEVEDILDMAMSEGMTFKQMTVAQFKDLWPVLKSYSVQQIGAALSRCGIESAKGAKGTRTRELPTPFASGQPF